jgi:hypothetical protein
MSTETQSNANPPPVVDSADLVDAAVKYTSRILWDKCTCCLGVGKLGIANTRRFMKCPLCNGKGETYKITSTA